MKQIFATVPLLLAATTLLHGAETDELLRKAQGTWARDVVESADPADRMVKVIEGNKETFSIYRGERLNYQHTVDFTIDVREGVTVFTFRNLKVTAGGNEGQSGEGEFSYLFQIRDDKWFEVQGMMNADTGTTPRLAVYERLKRDAQTPDAKRP